jgi:hypothetical protein
MSELNNIFNMFDTISRKMHDLGEIRAKKIQERRKEAQNNPFTRKRKSEAMKKYWADKKQKEIDDKEGRKLTYEYNRSHCTCHLGNPPCSFCTDSNYCENCDINTIEEECPNCGKIF